jgi:hypothetical protein
VTAREAAGRTTRTRFTERALTVDPVSAVVVMAQRPGDRRTVHVYVREAADTVH